MPFVSLPSLVLIVALIRVDCFSTFLFIAIAVLGAVYASTSVANFPPSPISELSIFPLNLKILPLSICIVTIQP